MSAWGGGCLPGEGGLLGVSAQEGCLPGGCLPGGGVEDTPMDRMIDI